MDQIVVKKEPEEQRQIYAYVSAEELVDNIKGDIFDQEMLSTSGIAIKQDIKEELDDSYNLMDYNILGLKEDLETSIDGEDNIDGGKPAKLKFEEALLDQGSKLNDEGSVNSDHGGESEDYSCNIKEGRDSDCSEGDDKKGIDEAMFETKIEVKYHGVQYDEISDKEKFYKCEICPKKYQTQMRLFNHKQYFHNKLKQEIFKCNKCDYASIKKGNFKIHSKIHDKKNYLKCQFCEYVAARLYSLNAHMLSNHKFENNIKISSKIYQCTKCSYSTVIKTNYETHIKVCLKLENVKWYDCKICPYKTIHKSHLITHTKTHSKIKELECLFCQFQSNRKQNLDNHILVKHSDLLNESNKTMITSKIHHCPQCNFKTTMKSHLKYHLRNHSIS
ncbi:unnamed protein product [Brassicogethes aeneus]|uniref:C2H2-type domain-containing protein n=1 Tax=Brassicogethes aeneus TaxID=1431903 RepID=A0A9P0BEJ8_BRAAE|nr:unnamed protein product [Brassicogethes aeneus]